MTTGTTLLIGGAIIAGAILWKRVGVAKDKAIAAATAATASASKVADSINHAADTIQPITGDVRQALDYVGQMFSAIGGSNLQKSYSGPGGGQFI